MSQQLSTSTFYFRNGDHVRVIHAPDSFSRREDNYAVVAHDGTLFVVEKRALNYHTTLNPSEGERS